ncbi:MAG: hypothetical protein B6U94_06875 [Thermofilum sp. ex4484_79]|nr:MAG: hypothetical protein B6U94_06875 [Thermofilum sp. ex4484_79]
MKLAIPKRLLTDLYENTLISFNAEFMKKALSQNSLPKWITNISMNIGEELRHSKVREFSDPLISTTTLTDNGRRLQGDIAEILPIRAKLV